MISYIDFSDDWRELMKIGYRTIKTAIGAALAVYIARLLDLDFYTSAGIITILCIQPTQKRSVISSLSRIAASAISIIYCLIIFEGIGYEPVSVGILIITLLPVLVYLKIQEGFVTSSVIIFHIYLVEHLTWDLILNELLIIIIGTVMALILNLYMPNMERTLRNYQTEIEKRFRIILKEFSIYLQNGESNWSGKELLEAEKYINKAKELAIKDIENHLIKPKESFYYYFTMRELQFEILERMLPIISSIDYKVEQREEIADYFTFLSDKVHPKDTVSESKQRLEEMQEALRKSELPKTREEFETRASLHHLTYEISQYLKIKEKSFQR
jgi:uncharacterized membrane protein YgaE (UPF0421/DUF939 family)